MSISIDDFSDPAFDVKAWVNRAAAGYVHDRPGAFDSALFSRRVARTPIAHLSSLRRTRRCPSQDPEHVEKHLAEVEMKLQLMAEDISLALEEQSVSGLRRIPRAVAEIDRVEHDTKSLQSRIQGILRRLDDAEGASRDAVRTLASVDKVKARMEHARETLANAAGLAELVASTDAVAATGDVRHIADVLASMRRGLRVVGDVPEFADAPERVEVLEKRLETLARPELVSALAAGDVARAEEMRDVLHVSGKIQTVFSAYAETRVVEPLLREWKAFANDTHKTASKNADEEAKRFAAWVPSYAAAVADAVRREVLWTSRAFPKESHELVVYAWRELSSLTKREFQQRAATKSLDLFAETYANAAEGFGKAARALLVTDAGEKTGVAPSAALAALAEALAPFEGVRARYAELEERALSEDGALAAALAAADEAARGGDAEATAAAAAAATAGLEEAAAAATARCEKLADGMETRAMLRALDAATVARVRGACVALRRLRVAKGMAVPPAEDEEEEAAAPARLAAAETRAGRNLVGSASVEADARAAVGLLAASAATTHRVDALTERLREWLSSRRDLNEALSLVSSSAGRDDPVPRDADAVTPAAAAVASDADEARALRGFLADASASSDPLPLARSKARAFADATHAFALETRASRALREFAGYARRPAWRDAGGDAGGDLPSFSAYPQEAVTNAGEYLLSLPQTLEQVAEAREEDRAAARDAAASAAAEALGSPRKPTSFSGQGPEEAEGPRARSAFDDAFFFEPELDPGEWMADVARLAADALVAEIRVIERLSETGAAQLAADAEYFANVVAALAPEPPKTLAAFAACCATPRENYVPFAASEDAAALGDVVAAVAAMRNIAT